MSPGATFERVYRALKKEISRGRFAPGEHLEPGMLSQDLNASITPVRDALHRLVGERLVETPRGEGFRVPAVTEVGLRHLYAWSAQLLLIATRSSGPTLPDVPQWADPDDHMLPAERLFLQIGGWTGNPEHVAAIARLNHRLRPIRIAEQAVLPDSDAEQADLEAAIEGDRAYLRRRIVGYHRRRERAAPDLVAHLLGLG